MKKLVYASLLLTLFLIPAYGQGKRGGGKIVIERTGAVTVTPKSGQAIALVGNTTVTGTATVSSTLAVTGASTLTGGVTVGTGNALTKLAKYTATLTPAEVAAGTCAEQLFTVTGITASDIVFVNKPTAQAGLGVAGVRASGANQVGINFCNTTVAGITPTAAEVYSFGAIR